MQRSHQERKFLAAGFSRTAMLAAGCRPVYHAALRHHPRCENRQAQCGHVPHAGVRRHHRGHALAAAKDRRRALSAGAARRGQQRESCSTATPAVQICAFFTKSAGKINLAEPTRHKRFVSGHDFQSCREVFVDLGFSPCCSLPLFDADRPEQLTISFLIRLKKIFLTRAKS